MAATPSNQFTFQMTIEEMIREAAQMAGGGPLDGEQLKSYVNSFNVLQQELLNRNYPLAWLVRGTLDVCSGCAQYTLNGRIYDIHNAVIETDDSSTEVRLERISLAEFNEIPTKSRTGRPTQFTVERLHDALNLRVWPTPDQTYTVNMYVFTKPDDLYKYTDTVRLQPRIYPAVLSGLAYQIAKKRGAPVDLLQSLKIDYEEQLKHAFHEDRERSSYLITPYLNTRGR